jgi:cyclohexanone monooxygenase
MAVIDFDPDALREKYREERDKRLRPDGNRQYVGMEGRFEHYLEDPYVEPIVRDPIQKQVDVVVIGGGFGGILAGARLREAGIEDICLIEKGGDFGGTWYWNRYPGAQCDIESYIYLPLLEEVGYVPKEKYSHAPEILEHSRALGRHFRLYDGALFQTEIKKMTWSDDLSRWIVETSRDDRIEARFVVMASGPLHRPKLPGVAGIADFTGHTFHTSRWDYEYTGGGPEGDLDKLHDKKVAIIGTGATAVQVVPHLGASAEHLYVFQRTPSSIDVRNNRPTDPAWAASLEPGWQKRRMVNFNNLVTGIPEAEDMVDDGWTDIIGNLMVRMRKGDGASTPEQMAEIVELADFEKMEQVRSRVDAIVEDPATAAALKPWYRQFCKRPCFHDEYLQTFNRPNVTLVDTQGRGVDRITQKGVVANGVEYEVDCIVFATGFEVGTDYSRRAGCEIVGREGVTLSAKWAEGTRTLHGMHAHGFPNLLLVSNSQAGFTVNFPHMLDEQSHHLAYIVREAMARGVKEVEATKEAEDAWVQTILDTAVFNADFQESCTPGYYNNEGQPSSLARQNGFFGLGANAFVSIIEEWRAAGDLPGLELRS